jgi:hypothetical protein
MTTVWPQLVKDLRLQVTTLEKDLLARAQDVAEFAERLDAEYRAAREAERTAAGFTEWRQGRVTQAAAAWVLGTVFVRYSEDNGLIGPAFLSGPGPRREEAEERHEQFFREHPNRNDRDWLLAAIEHLSAAHPTAAGLFDRRHNPLWELTPSFEAATALIAFWRRRGDDGDIRYSFRGQDTRFLGDLYQDLSEAARKTYALLQTPEFVEEFILDLTLTPAIEEFGLAGLRTIDPASGSGHFLLGLFHRILAAWQRREPNTDPWELIRRSLESVHGCDKNPFATSIARFRLLAAALEAAGERRLDRAGEFPINVAVGDSLLHGRGAPGRQGELFEVAEPHTYTSEDVNDFVASCDLLGRATYHVVVGNPPYITVKDKLENQAYRDRYASCSGKYALSVPFAERLFQLAVRTAGSDRAAGFVAQITANSFMRRQFGKKLIEKVFPSVHLTHVLDTSGVSIPGHGTPTVILVGRNHVGRFDVPVRAVLGIRGDSTRSTEPQTGGVWRAIVDQVSSPASRSYWVASADVERASFATYPWSVSGGGERELFAVLEEAGVRRLHQEVASIGFAAVTGNDDAYVVAQPAPQWFLQSDAPRRDFVVGDQIRDWCLGRTNYAIYPVRVDSSARQLIEKRLLWSQRALLSAILYFGENKRQRGLSWSDYAFTSSDRLGSSTLIAFAFLDTHNHFTIDRGGPLFNHSAPVLMLPTGSTEGEHLELLGLLNSSTTCFWLKQVCHNKGAGGGSSRGEKWLDFYEITGSKVREIPVPASRPGLGRELDRLAQLLATQEPSAVCERETPTREALDLARSRHAAIRQEMVAKQEELDWTVYRAYDLITETEAKTLVYDGSAEPLALGERAFEIVLARRVAAGEVETAWFDRHGSTPITELPAHWSPGYRAVVQARIDIIEQRRDLALIERPECKRRWASPSWEKKEAEALRTWLLDRCERPELWSVLRDGETQPRTMTVSQLADRLDGDPDVVSVAQLYAADHLGKRDLTLAKVLESVIADEHVPYLAALRYKDSGLVTRAEWERTWELQREEDRTGQNLHIPVPPKYKPADFRKVSYWAQRGKLDVPKERFVSYPGASPDADPTLLLGWAGWDHKDQAQALVNLVNDRESQAGWGSDRITPLLAGLAEVLPWVHQWHGEYDEDWGGNPAEEYQAYLDERRTRHGLTLDALRAWRPAPVTRGRRRS